MAGLTCLAFALRLSALHQSLFGDEIFTYRIVTGRGLLDVVEEVRDTAITPPLHYLLAHAAVQIGDPTEWIRVPSVLCGAATVPVVYLLGRRVAGSSAGLVAAAIVALSPFAIFYGSESRAYATMMFLVALSTLTLLRALEARSAWRWVLYFIVSVAALYAHYSAVFVIGAQSVWALWAHRQHWRAIVAANLAIALGYLPWLPSLVKHSGNEVGIAVIGGSSPPSVSTFFEYFARLVPGHPYAKLNAIPGRTGIVLLAVAGAGVILAAVFKLAEGKSAWRPNVRSPAGLTCILALTTPVALLIYNAVGSNLYIPRNLSASLPALVIAIAALLTSLRPYLAAAATACVLGALAIGTGKSLSEDYRRPPMREAAEYIDDMAKPGDAVVAKTGSLKLFPLGIYFDQPRKVLRAGIDDADAWERAERRTSVFVVTTQTGFYTGLRPTGGPENKYVLRAGRTFEGLFRVSVGRYSGKVRATLRTRGPTETIRWSLGKAIVVKPGSATGSVDVISRSSNTVNLRGWAADGAAHKVADWVLAFSGRLLVAIGQPKGIRGDVAEAHGKALLISGFSLTGPIPASSLARLAGLRTFAVVGDQASELPISKSAKRALKQADR